MTVNAQGAAGPPAGNQTGDQNGGTPPPEQGQQQGQEQGGTGTGPDLSNLLDDAANTGTDGDQSDSGSGTGDHQQSGSQGSGPEALTADAVARIVESAIDRRLNTARMRQQQQQQQQQGNAGNDQQQGSGRQEQSHQPPQTSTGIDPADLREARAEYRDSIGSEIRFLSGVERDHAASVASGLIQQRLARGDDPDAAGREVAREVAASMKALRKHYEEATVAALRRRGALPATQQGEQPPHGGSGPGDASAFAKGQSKAAEMFPGRVKTT